MSQKNITRRIARLKITPSTFMFLFDDKRVFICKKGLPSGSVFRGFAHDYSDNTFVLFIENPTFDEVPEGEYAPTLDPIRFVDLAAAMKGDE